MAIILLRSIKFQSTAANPKGSFLKVRHGIRGIHLMGNGFYIRIGMRMGIIPVLIMDHIRLSSLNYVSIRSNQERSPY